MENDKQQPNNTQHPEKQPTSKPRRWLKIIMYLLAFGLIGYYFFGESPTKGVSYTELKSYIEAEAIEKIEVSGDLKAKAKVLPQTEACDVEPFEDNTSETSLME